MKKKIIATILMGALLCACGNTAQTQKVAKNDSVNKQVGSVAPTEEKASEPENKLPDKPQGNITAHKDETDDSVDTDKNKAQMNVDTNKSVNAKSSNATNDQTTNTVAKKADNKQTNVETKKSEAKKSDIKKSHDSKSKDSTAKVKTAKKDKKSSETNKVIDKTTKAVSKRAFEKDGDIKCAGYATGEADSIYSGDMESISKDATDIVRGTIQKVTFDAIDGLAYTKADVLVEETVKGDLKENTMISIYSMGGYISLTDHIADCHDAEDYKDVKKEDWDTTYIKMDLEAEEFAKVGDHNVFYLVKTPSGDAFPDGTYQRFAGRYGQMKVMNENKDLRHCNPDVNEGTPYETFTWDEIVKAAQAK